MYIQLIKHTPAACWWWWWWSWDCRPQTFTEQSLERARIHAQADVCLAMCSCVLRRRAWEGLSLPPPQGRKSIHILYRELSTMIEEGTQQKKETDQLSGGTRVAFAKDCMLPHISNSNTNKPVNKIDPPSWLFLSSNVRTRRPDSTLLSLCSGWT